ncbi:MAG: ABC transporter ATP-binding protein [Bacteroidetes bacterium]|nr:ABC transporter ATP-binding protein [Bacteroidota bacterium]
MSAISIQHISKNYGSIAAVNNLSLEIQQGEMFALVGPDGVGKTTLMRMLCGIVKPDSGRMNILGLDVQSQLNGLKNKIGYLSQKFSLYGDLTIDENIEFFAEIHNIHSFHDRRNELLEFTRLTPFRTRLAEKLSGGMKQKLALACTLIHAPEVIFLDEPTTGVDPVSRRDFWKVLSSLLKSGITIVLTTPYLDEAERCAHVALMNNGKILVHGTPEKVKEEMNGEVVEVVTTEIRKSFSHLKTQPAVKEVQAFGDRIHLVVADAKNDMNSILTGFAENNIPITDWRVIKPNLENVFISLLTKNESH